MKHIHEDRYTGEDREFSGTVLSIGNAVTGSLMTELKINDYYRIMKVPYSSVKNWESICDILEADISKDLIVISKFTEKVLFLLTLPEYKNVIARLIPLIKERKNLSFVYKDNLLSSFNGFISEKSSEDNEQDDDLDFMALFHGKKLSSWLKERDVSIHEGDFTQMVNSLILNLSNELELLSYEKIIDIEVSGKDFLEKIVEGLILKIYIPENRIYSKEYGQMISLFRDYSKNIKGKKIEIKQTKTDSGTIYALYSKDFSLNDSNFQDIYSDFQNFLVLCVNEPSRAQQIISYLDIKDSKKQQILSKFVKESHRLDRDLRHEKETKKLNLVHRLEDEIGEVHTDDVISNIPTVHGDINLPINIFGNVTIMSGNNNTYGDNPNVKNIIIEELEGDFNFNETELDIKRIIETQSDDIKRFELLSSLHELADKELSASSRTTAKQKILSFLIRVQHGAEAGGVAVALEYLAKYLITGSVS
jgi:hypothetical protein